MPFGRPFRAISLGVPFPGLKPLGCFLFALRALGTRTRKCPNSRGTSYLATIVLTLRDENYRLSKCLASSLRFSQLS